MPNLKIRTLNEPSGYLKLAFFGTWGSGKTYTIASVARLGFRSLVISSDIGGSGLLTVRNALKKEPEKLALVTEIEVSDYDSLRAFLDTPKKFVPDLDSYQFLIWDGFSTYQHLLLGEWIVNRNPSDNAEIMRLEIQDWNTVRNLTLRDLHDFLTLGNQHKIVTFQEGYRLKPPDPKTKRSELAETRMPLLQGVSQYLAGAGFDLIIHCRAFRDPITKKTLYFYDLSGSENLAAKQRGFDLEPEMPADFAALWQKIQPK